MEKKTKQVILTRTFPAGIDRLWDAFTNVEDMLKWHAPKGMRNPQVEVDLRVGGKYAVAMKYDETGEVVTVRGIYKVIDRPTKLVYTWKWDTSDMDETEVTIMFHQEAEDKTMVTLIHSGFNLSPSAHDVKNNWTDETHKQGWTTAFEKLESMLTS